MTEPNAATAPALDDPDWRLYFVLPHLLLPPPAVGAPERFGDYSGGISFGSGWIALVPPEDPRVVAACRAERAALQLLSGFTDHHNRPVRVSACVLHRGAPARLQQLDAVIAFRNAVALGFLLRGRAMAVDRSGFAGPLWSDQFDFHPATLTDRGRLIIDTPGLRMGFSEKAPFRAMPADGVVPLSGPLYPDGFLCPAFDAAWTQHFESDDGTDRTAALFRSLEVAMMAAALPFRNRGALNDHGVHLALWVSALEILAWAHSGAGHASEVAVLDMIGAVEWDGKLGTPRHPWKKKGEHRTLTSVQYAAAAMYAVRNDFLHGNRVSPESLLHDTPDGRIAVPVVAALIFRTALVAFLAPPVPFDLSDDADLTALVERILESSHYADALRFAIGASEELENDT